MTPAPDSRPLVAHVVYRFDVGGLENGLVNLINRTPPDLYRHAVIALTEVTDFRRRITRSDVQFVSMYKALGHGIALYPRLFRLFRTMRPTIVHTRNLAALEATVPAYAAGVRVRIHGEHGRDVGDYEGRSRKYQWLRRAYRPFVSHYVALSRDLEAYLHARVGIPRAKITQIYNGVDLERFRPTPSRAAPAVGDPFGTTGVWRVGTVGRMQSVKDPLNLARAFLRARELAPAARDQMRLLMIGDGPLYAEVQALLSSAGAGDVAWLPGERDDIPAILASLDCFVLPSRAEGISNTILEAMASRLPVIATCVGGNVELVVEGVTGELVPPADPDALARQIVRFWADPEVARRAGEAGRARAQAEFSLDTMVKRYQDVYDCLLEAKHALAMAGSRIGT
jgi:sugar transferase (PEP-CTERM/EpsH1 system associated)